MKNNCDIRFRLLSKFQLLSESNSAEVIRCLDLHLSGSTLRETRENQGTPLTEVIDHLGHSEGVQEMLSSDLRSQDPVHRSKDTPV